MRNFSFYKTIVFLALFFAAISASAWNHGISIGYGGGNDINHPSISNSGGILTGSFLPVLQRKWLQLTFDGSLGEFYSYTPTNQNLFTAALSLGFRFYALQSAKAHPYFLLSVGPAYLSNRRFGVDAQGSNFAFQSLLGLGVEIGEAKRVDLNLKLVHYSNAYLSNPNNGYNIMYVGSIGYLF